MTKLDKIINAAGLVAVSTALAGAGTVVIPVNGTMRGDLVFYETKPISLATDWAKQQPSFSNLSVLVRNESGAYKPLNIPNSAKHAGALTAQPGQSLIIVFSEPLSNKLGLTHLGKWAQSIRLAPG